MFGKLTLCMMLMVFLSGFTLVSEQLKDQLKKSPQQYTQFDVKMGWTVTTGNSGTVISGVIQNVRYVTMEEIEIWVSVLDTKGKTVARGVEYILPRSLALDDVASFSVGLPAVASPGAKLLFTYKYLGFDGGGTDNDATKWMQSFESVIPAGY